MIDHVVVANAASTRIKLVYNEGKFYGVYSLFLSSGLRLRLVVSLVMIRVTVSSRRVKVRVRDGIKFFPMYR